MKKTSIKNTLLMGTAVVAGFAFATTAQAADLTITGSATWASAGGTGGANIANADAGDNVNLSTGTGTVTVTNDTTADDGSANTNTFVLGNVTDTDGATASVNIVAGSGNDLTATVGSADVAGSFAVTGADGNDADIAATVTGALTTGTTLTVLSDGNTQANTSSLAVGGDLTVGTTTAVTAGAFAGNSSASLDVTGNSTFTGAVTVTGGANALADSTVTLSGATNAFAGGLTLTDGAAGSATLVLDGTVAQSVSGDITGTGDISVTNTYGTGVTFSGDVAPTVTVDSDTNDQAVTFTGDVAAVNLGGGGNADTITATFGGSEDTAISGAITANATEVAAVNFVGGNTVTLTGAVVAADTTSITGNTTVTTNQNFASAAVTVASGSTLATTGNTITGAVANSGTLSLAGGVGVVGDITGAGAIVVTENALLNGEVAAKTATVADTKTLTVDAGHDYVVGTTTLSGTTGALTVTAGSAITGNVYAAADGEGALNVLDTADTTAITGHVGSASKKLATFKIDDAGTGSATIVSTTGNLYVNAIEADDASTLSFVGTKAQAVSGTLAGGIHNTAATSNVTFMSDVSGVDANITNGGKVRFEGDATYSGDYTQGATSKTTIAAGKTLSVDDIVSDDIGMYELEVSDAGFAKIVSATDSTLTKDNLMVNVIGKIDTSAAFTQVLDNVTVAAGDLNDNSALYKFVASVNGGDAEDVDITASKVSLASLTSGNNDGASAVLDTLFASTNTEISAFTDKLAAASTAGAIDELVESVSPTVDGGAIVAGVSAGSQSLGVNSGRMSSLRSGTGVSTGNFGDGVEAWVKGFGSSATQDVRDGVDGFDADTYGLAFGADTEGLVDGAVIGAAFSYATSDIESDNANATESDVDSFQFSVYGDYDLDDATYVAGSVGFAMNNIDQKRFNVGGATGTTASADYDSAQYMLSAEVGRAYPMGNAVTVTPTASLGYQHVSVDGYTETGAGGLNSKVDTENMNILELGIGAEASMDIVQDNGSRIIPALTVGYRYDVIGDEVESTSSFTAGGASFKSKGADADQSTFNVGASVTLMSADQWNVTGAYDYEFKSDYDSHAGYIRAGYQF